MNSCAEKNIDGNIWLQQYQRPLYVDGQLTRDTFLLFKYAKKKLTVRGPSVSRNSGRGQTQSRRVLEKNDATMTNGSSHEQIENSGKETRNRHEATVSERDATKPNDRVHLDSQSLINELYDTLLPNSYSGYETVNGKDLLPSTTAGASERDIKSVGTSCAVNAATRSHCISKDKPK